MSKNWLHIVCTLCAHNSMPRLGIVIFFIQMLGEPALFGFHVLTERSFEVNLPWLSQLTLRTIIPEKKQLWMRSVVWPSFSTKSSLRLIHS